MVKLAVVRSGETPVQLSPISGEEFREELMLALRLQKVKLVDSRLGTFQTYELERRRNVLYLNTRGRQPICIIPVGLVGVLFGNQGLRELPMTLSCLRAAGRSIRPVLHCGAFDAIAITYCYDELAIVVDAALLLEKMKK